MFKKLIEFFKSEKDLSLKKGEYRLKEKPWIIYGKAGYIRVDLTHPHVIELIDKRFKD